MAKLSRKIIFKFKYTDLGIPINGFTSAIIHHDMQKKYMQMLLGIKLEIKKKSRLF